MPGETMPMQPILENLISKHGRSRGGEFDHAGVERVAGIV